MSVKLYKIIILLLLNILHYLRMQCTGNVGGNLDAYWPEDTAKRNFCSFYSTNIEINLAVIHLANPLHLVFTSNASTSENSRNIRTNPLICKVWLSLWMQAQTQEKEKYWSLCLCLSLCFNALRSFSWWNKSCCACTCACITSENQTLKNKSFCFSQRSHIKHEWLLKVIHYFLISLLVYCGNCEPTLYLKPNENSTVIRNIWLHFFEEWTALPSRWVATHKIYHSWCTFVRFIG